MTIVLSPTPAFRQARRADERVRVMGRAMDLVRPEEVWTFVARKIAAGEKSIIANHNLHSLHLVAKDAELARFFDIADLIEVDSTPLLAWAQLTSGKGRCFHRCTYLDWRDDFWPRAVAEGWRVFYLGGAPGVAARAADHLRGCYPGVQLAVRDGYFDMTEGSTEAQAVTAEVAAFKPHIVFVGMGMPRQEAWIVRNHAVLPPCAIFSVGAAFDYEAGVQKAAPRWTGRLGIEWLYRLVSDPKRLFRRYCIEPWFLIPAALGDVARLITAEKPTDRRQAGSDRRADRPKDWNNPGRRGADLRGRPASKG
jgi:N-acetylglucosaminyldiphosphoundecaprenol N-acetyl-beta-D-mannosaminyltransferase